LLAAAERDIDLALLLRRLRRRALALAFCVLCGLVIGYLAWRTGARDFRARTVLFVTQTSGLAQPASLAVIADSLSVLGEAARQTGLPVGQLAGSISATPLASRTTSGALYFRVSVRGRRRKATLTASRLIGSALLNRIDDYQVAQIAAANAQLAEAKRELAHAKRREVLSQSLNLSDPLVRLTTLGLIQQLATSARARIVSLQTQLAQAEAQRSQIVGSSVTPTGARSRTSSSLVGATIGLILGILISLALPEHRPPAPSPPGTPTARRSDRRTRTRSPRRRHPPADPHPTVETPPD
jgi:hypothetical protein